MDQFVGEIRLVGFNYAPRGWAFCQGQTLPINQNVALYALLGTQYGGDGRTNFALPNLNGNIAINAGQGPGLSGYQQGQTGGVTSVTLTTAQMPGHTHTLPAASGAGGTTSIPSPSVVLSGGGGRGLGHPFYTSVPGTVTTMASSGIAGGSQAHNNMGPYLVLNYIIALQGIFPTRP